MRDIYSVYVSGDMLYILYACMASTNTLHVYIYRKGCCIRILYYTLLCSILIIHMWIYVYATLYSYMY